MALAEPVRKIDSSWVTTTALIRCCGRSVWTEGPTAMRFVETLRMHSYVRNVVEEPCQITYKDGAGKTRRYTPDFLVVYELPEEYSYSSTVLYEIKWSGDLRENYEKYEERFAAAYKYAAERGWRFRVITEKRIDRYHRSATLLHRFLRRKLEYEHVRYVLDTVTLEPGITAHDFLDAELSPVDPFNLLTTIWTLLAREQISAELEGGITNRTPLFPARAGNPWARPVL